MRRAHASGRENGMNVNVLVCTYIYAVRTCRYAVGMPGAAPSLHGPLAPGCPLSLSLSLYCAHAFAPTVGAECTFMEHTYVYFAEVKGLIL